MILLHLTMGTDALIGPGLAVLAPNAVVLGVWLVVDLAVACVESE